MFLSTTIKIEKNWYLKRFKKMPIFYVKISMWSYNDKVMSFINNIYLIQNTMTNILKIHKTTIRGPGDFTTLSPFFQFS